METTPSEPPASSDYQLLTDPEFRQELKDGTLALVRKSEQKDALFFLDRSARPLAHLYRHVFPMIFPNQRQPEIRFLNIGNEKLGHFTSIFSTDPYNLRFLHSREGLEKRFGSENIAVLEALLKAPKGTRKMIVDDTVVGGDTLRLTHILTRELDPESKYDDFVFNDRIITPFEWIQGLGLVNDDDEASFLTSREDLFRESGLQLREDLDKLAVEIARDLEEGTTLRGR